MFEPFNNHPQESSAIPVLEQLAAEISDEQILIAWRAECLFQLGCDAQTAFLMAENGVSHHDVEALLARGCPPATAARILAS